MRYAVTGSIGFIGSHLVRELGDRGHDVVTYDRRDPEYPIDLATDDFSFAGCDGVFHLAAKPGVRSFGDVFADYARDNLVALERVLHACSDAGARCVFASSSSVYGAPDVYPTREDEDLVPLSPYGITKMAGEHLVHAYELAFNLDAVVLRYFNAFGPGQRPDMAFAKLIDCLHTGEEFPMYGDGGQSRGYTYISDVVAASILAMEEAPPGEVLNVGGGVEVTLAEAINLLADISGRHLLRYRPCQAVPGDQRRSNADTTKLRALGWQPKVGVGEGLRRQWDASL